MAFHMNTNRRAAMSEINVTPLVDVMLVLLIIFMVTAPMMQEGVTVDLPAAEGKPVVKEHQSQEIVISVAGPGKIYLNDAEIQEKELTQKVVDSTKDDSSRGVYLRADKTVPYGLVVRIMAALQGAGVKNLNIITTPAERAPERQ